MAAAAEGEALVVCGDKTSAGITVWDLESGDVLFRIPTCGSPPRGLVCLRDRILFASQLHKDRPFAGGAIFSWYLNKQPHTPHRSYPMEAIGPMASSKDGIYLAGGAPSGSAYIWEVTSGKLIKYWHAHHSSLSCLAFSHDDSFLISGSDDGTVSIWSMISVLNIADPQACQSLPSFHSWSGHESSVTGLLPLSGMSTLTLVSSSCDDTCKVWDLVSGRLLQNHMFSVAITAIAIDPGEQQLFAGREDGKIYANALHLGLPESRITVSEDESRTLCGHKGSITALTFGSGGSWLISASEDNTVCLWDVASWQIIRIFTHGKSNITNLVVIPRSCLSMSENHRRCFRSRVSLLDKGPQPNFTYEGALTSLPEIFSQEDHLLTNNFRSSGLLKKQILDSEKGRTSEVIQMRIETNVKRRLWILGMTKHVNTINRHLQERVVDIMQYRLSGDDTDIACPRRSKTDDTE